MTRNSRKRGASLRQLKGGYIDWFERISVLEGMHEGSPSVEIPNDTKLSEADFVQRLRMAIYRYFNESLEGTGLRFRVLCSGNNGALVDIRRK